jgi:hypothetical protein
MAWRIGLAVASRKGKDHPVAVGRVHLADLVRVLGVNGGGEGLPPSTRKRSEQ